MNLETQIYKHALKNACTHDGKAQIGPVINKIIGEFPEIKEKIGEIGKKVKAIVDEVNKMSLEEQKKRLLEIWPDALEKKEELPKELVLPDAEIGKVVLRLAPFPSGPLHLGNAKTYLLNAICAEKYKGKLYFVMDDTISSEEKAIVPEAYKLIPEGFEWLNVKWDGDIIYKSDRLELYYDFAKKIIEKGKAYVCKCSQDVLRENRAKGIECEHRNQSVEETMKEFEKMIAGEYKEGEAVLRLKTDMKHPNPAFRDRVLIRICEREHPRVGKKHKAWPLLELTWAYDDYALGVTHILRGKDLMMESEVCKYIWNLLGIKPPKIIHLGLIQIEGVKISKSKAQKEVMRGVYSGWDDPRTWSLQSLRRRGIQPEAIREFVESIGINEHDITVPIEKLYAINRKIIDEKCNRYFFVENSVKIKIDNLKECVVNVFYYPGKNERGFKEYKFKEDEYVFLPYSEVKNNISKIIRLKDAFAIKIYEEGKAEFVDTSDLSMPKIQWVTKDNIPCKVVMPDGEVKQGLVEKYIEREDVGSLVQFERFGYARLDSKGKEYVFYYAHP
ncbi:MAG: glutamate--tRNA ligase [archaeon]